MRLRESIRPPERYASELFYQPTPQRSLRNGRNTKAANYIDFNPNHPPAAFPTLDEPRPTGSPQTQKRSEDQQTEDQNGDIHMRDATVPSGNGARPGRVNAETVDELDDIPIDEIENYLASNGPRNPIYARNMAIITECASDDGMMWGSDENDENDQCHDSGNAEVPPAPDPEWGDLSPRLQVEIIENLLQTHSWGRIMSKLGLTVENCRKVQEHIKSRNKQIELENTQLKEMREKQLRALMRIDNSELKLNRVPHQLVFRKTSRQYSRKLRESIASDYLLCQAGEVLGARRFLHKRGLDPRYAGDWNNEMVVLRKSQGDLDTETFEWKDDSEDDSEPDSQGPDEPLMENGSGEHTPSVEQVDVSTDCQATDDPLQTRIWFINEVGTAGTVDPADLRIRIGDLSTPTHRQSTTGHQSVKEASQQTPRRNGIVRLKIGSERAARIRDSGDFPEYSRKSDLSVSQPETQHKTQPETGQFDGSSRTVSPFPVIPQKRPVAGLFQKPVRRILGGPWSYDSLQQNPDPRTSSMKLRERLEEARAEAQIAGVVAGTPQVYGVEASMSDLRNMESNSLTRMLPIRTSPQRTPYQEPPSNRKGFHGPVPDLVDKAEAFTSNASNKNEPLKGPNVSPMPSILEQTAMHCVPDLAGDPEHGPAYSPITPPLGQNLFQELKSEQGEDASPPRIATSELKPAEEDQRKTESVDEKEHKAFKSITEDKQGNEQKYGRDETPEIKKCLASVPLHIKAIDSGKADISPTSTESQEENERRKTADVREPASNIDFDTTPAPIRIIIRQPKEQRRSDPDNQVTVPEQNVSTPQTETPQPGSDPTVSASSSCKTHSSKAKKSSRSSTPGTSTRQKASTKKTPLTEPTRRSERLNGPPNQRVLRKRS
ncbi:hypothetical protein VTN00DRAFT_9090 [Thermoascus crustaceus]|uniref:uncharacterized protein n=1 Tax=Thermoascus crustaceus TaxID=5088 RepID=UPI00374336AF